MYAFAFYCELLLISSDVLIFHAIAVYIAAQKARFI